MSEEGTHDFPAPLGDVVGTSVPRLDAREKVAGRAVYTDDMTLPGMLHGAMLGSPHAHARILSCDTSRARAMPGVKAVLTAEDLPPLRFGTVIKDQSVLARGKVRHSGDPVAAVAAVDIETARRALQAIDIEYEVLPAVFDPEEALRDGAPVVHEQRLSYTIVKTQAHAATGDVPNIASHIRLIEGEPDEVWRDCDVIVEDVYEAPAQQHVYLEPCTTLATVDVDSGKVTIYTSTQTVFRVQAITAEALGIPMSKIRVIAPRVGGGFGAKTEVTNQPITAALARAAGAPVKMTLSREDDMTMMKSRHACRIYMRTGATSDGRLLARQVRLYFDTGAYAEEGPHVAALAAYFARGPYRIPHVDIECWCVYTNHLRAAAFRGFGNPQIHFPGEVQVDEVAERLGMDPFDLRIQNALTTGEAWLGGTPVEDGTLRECLERAREASGWAQRRQQSKQTGKRRGIGVAAVAHVCALLGTSASVRLNEDGTVTVNTGAMDIGQGADTALAQCAAGALGLTLDQINYTSPDTDLSPYDWCTAGSRVTYTVGRAIVEACEQVKQQLFAQASEILGRPLPLLELQPGGFVGVQGEPEARVSFAAMAGRALYVEGGPIIGTHRWLYESIVLDPKRTLIEGLPTMGNGMFVFAAQVVEVEVDELTGKVELIEAWSVHDVGRAIHPAATEGQIQGGFVQGLGYALTEELVWHEGRLANPSMTGYKVLGAPDVPVEIHPILLEYPGGDGPFGAKGVAEVGLVGVAPAVCNAIRHATGARVAKIPATGERVLRALLDPERKMPAPDRPA